MDNIEYNNELLARTYLIFDAEELQNDIFNILAYFSLSINVLKFSTEKENIEFVKNETPFTP